MEKKIEKAVSDDFGLRGEGRTERLYSSMDEFLVYTFMICKRAFAEAWSFKHTSTASNLNL